MGDFCLGNVRGADNAKIAICIRYDSGGDSVKCARCRGGGGGCSGRTVSAGVAKTRRFALARAPPGTAGLTLLALREHRSVHQPRIRRVKNVPAGIGSELAPEKNESLLKLSHFHLIKIL